MAAPNLILTPPTSSPQAIRLVSELGQSLHRWGAPASELEAAMESVARALGLGGQFFVTPTAIYLSFQFGEDYQTVLLRSDAGDVDLVRLAALEELVAELVDGEIDPDAAQARLVRLRAARSRYGPAWTTFGFLTASAATAVFMGGGWRESLLSAVVGALVAGLSLAATRWRMLARVFAPLAAFLVTVLAGVAAPWLGATSAPLVTLAGLIILVPGLTVTMAFTELATRHLVSGVARLAGASTVFLLIGLGVAFGRQVVAADPAIEPVGLPMWATAVALAVSPLSFLILFQGPARQVLAVALAAWLAFGSARLGAMWWSPELGVFTGAFLVGLAGNLFARWRRQPSSILVVPGIMFLVPGSLGFKSVVALSVNDLTGGLQAGFLMVMVGMALATGLVLANVMMPVRRPRRI